VSSEAEGGKTYSCIVKCAFYGAFFIFCDNGGIVMETRVAVVGIIVENPESVEKLNAILHEYGEYIIGRMGIPYRQKKISIISIAVDAPQDIISALSGKIGRLPGVSAKTAYSNVVTKQDERDD
jgi:putative iron-only hydrogenase system regulator